MSSNASSWRRPAGGNAGGDSRAGGPPSNPSAGGGAQGSNYGVGRGGDGQSGEFSGNNAYGNQRSNYRGRGGRGGGRGFRGRGRGGRGGRDRDFYSGRRQDDEFGPDVDEADLYQKREITRHFWAEEAGSADATHSSTFHDSIRHQGQLSYMLLFSGANPRWQSDNIVFAKSHLKLLPEYEAKKAEYGPWEVTKARQESKAAASDGADAGGFNPDPEQPPQESDEKPMSEDATEGTKQPAVEGIKESPVEGTGEKTAGEKTAEEKAAQATKDKTIEGSAKKAETATDAAATGASTQDAAPTEPAPPRRFARFGAQDIRLLPPEEQYPEPEPEPEEPVYPSIQPIDYIPNEHPPIAVFAERRRVAKDTFFFVGWFKVARVNVLSPLSAELVRMQQQKWEQRARHQRDAGAWQAAMNQEWSVVKFEKLADDVAPPPPVIEKMAPPPSEREGDKETKGVNDQLQDMRYGNEKQDALPLTTSEDKVAVEGEENVTPSQATEV
ncbi:uncharacterized protein BCR38DRAFT_482968 [Pseudomassariella vexata]|uniref:Uncharacterized protein n=1 Tax=Pseudomassariella vexata TaxID=1141098 RepID=A0A1Y2E707_9PEZI|nr:uncharacterized protein BCR38DRAFT_482968 [Pseudomassariella vexata]ORY67348.1 hypothetical protein BCR38DRAFT_482968 [Pseudomassariella vexata]